MIRLRFLRLLHPGSLLTIAALIAGCNLGMAYALTAYHQYLSRDYEISREEWGKFNSDAWGLAPNITATVLLFYVLATFASPEARSSDRQQLRELARKKLGSSVLTTDELSFWNRVLEEVERDA